MALSSTQDMRDTYGVADRGTASRGRRRAQARVLQTGAACHAVDHGGI